MNDETVVHFGLATSLSNGKYCMIYKKSWETDIGSEFNGWCLNVL